MPLFQLILIALIHGITEFLPVSSSWHLILLPGLTGLADQGQMIDVAVHVGTLGAVVLYFWRDVQTGLAGLVTLVQGRTDTPGARLARMSGSGATCFALFETIEAAQSAARTLERAHPSWWIRATSLGDAR